MNLDVSRVAHDKDIGVIGSVNPNNRSVKDAMLAQKFHARSYTKHNPKLSAENLGTTCTPSNCPWERSSRDLQLAHEFTGGPYQYKHTQSSPAGVKEMYKHRSVKDNMEAKKFNPQYGQLAEYFCSGYASTAANPYNAWSEKVRYAPLN